MNLIGVSKALGQPQASAGGPVSFTDGHHFTLTGQATVEQLAEAVTVPLSVILQVTKRCNFDCSFCSETLQLPDPQWRSSI